MKNFLVATSIALVSLFANPINVSAQEDWSLSGFSWPESALWDKARQHYILSNINGNPTEADGKGYLSKISSDGKVLKAKWVTGLDAPKGMALVGHDLIVADLGNIHVIDSKTGEKRETIAVPDAKLLNDVTSNGKEAWISDWMGNGIWHYRDGKVTLWYQGEEIIHPNGLLVENDHLLVGTWGEEIQADFTTKVPGDLKAIDLKEKTVTTLAKSVGNLDGVIRFKGRLLTNDWITGQIFEISDTGEAKEIMKLKQGLADISHDGSALLLPFMLEGELKRQELK